MCHVDPGQNARPGGRGCAKRLGGGAFPGRNAILHAGRHGAEGGARSPRPRPQRPQEQRLQVPPGARRGQLGAGRSDQGRRPLRPRHRRRLADGHGAARKPPSPPAGVSRRTLALRRVAPGARRVLRRGEAGRQRSAPSVADSAAAGAGAAFGRRRLSRRQPARSRAPAAGRRIAASASAPNGGTPAAAQRGVLGRRARSSPRQAGAGGRRSRRPPHADDRAARHRQDHAGAAARRSAAAAAGGRGHRSRQRLFRFLAHGAAVRLAALLRPAPHRLDGGHRRRWHAGRAGRSGAGASRRLVPGRTAGVPARRPGSVARTSRRGRSRGGAGQPDGALSGALPAGGGDESVSGRLCLRRIALPLRAGPGAAVPKPPLRPAPGPHRHPRGGRPGARRGSVGRGFRP